MEQPPSNSRTSDRQLITRLLPLALLLAGGSCGLFRAPAPRLTPPMAVQAPLRKQVLQGYMPFGSIGWVNNEQVVFSGIPIGSKDRHSLYLWNVREKPRLLLRNSPGGCASEGTIWAAQLSEKGKYRQFALQAPNFILRPATTNQTASKSKFESISCTSVATPLPLEKRTWKPLRKGDGFLDFGSNEDTPGFQSVSHLDTDLRTKHETGILMEKPMLPMALYAAYDGSYLIFDLNVSEVELERWHKTGRRRIWRLDTHWLGTPLEVPYGAWSNQDISFQQARPGLLITSNNFARKGAPGGAGLYLLPPGRPVQRLERGLVEEPAVSPDGCRIAYGYRPRLDTGIPEGGPRLVVLDLCVHRTPRAKTREQ
jgi:hypothetical protein